MKYRVVSITNNLADYPQDEADTKEFPELIEWVEDEEEVFIVDEVGHFWPADEFFFMIEIKEFEANLSRELKYVSGTIKRLSNDQN